MSEQTWARSREAGPAAEWHALLDEARRLTVCGERLEGPVDTRDRPPGFNDAACAQCYVRATDLAEVFREERVR